MKNKKQCLDSIFIDSTALCIELAPSPPLRARPGPSMPHYKRLIRLRIRLRCKEVYNFLILIILLTSAAIVIHKRPKAIPPVVVAKYPNWIKPGTLGSISRLRPPQQKPAKRALYEAIVWNVYAQQFSSFSLMFRVRTCKSVKVEFLIALIIFIF